MHFSHFEYDLTKCHNLSDYMKTLEEHFYLLGGVLEAYLCLNENWWDMSNPESSFIYFYRFYEQNTEAFLHCGRNDILSIVQQSNAPKAYYFVPLFHAEHSMGYIVLTYDTPTVYDYGLRSWMKTASNALEFILMKNNIEYLTKCQNLSESRDSVTGLYHSEAFRKQLKRLTSGIAENERIMLILLKTEMFSAQQFEELAQRNAAAISISDSLQALFKDGNFIIGRLESGIYAIAAAGNFTENKVHILTELLRAYLYQNPVYRKICSSDIFFLKYSLVTHAEFDYDRLFSAFRAEISEYLKSETENRKRIHYIELLNFRNNLYFYPLQAESAESVCRHFYISKGYFHNIYNKYFGHGYHHDCVLARLYLVRFLLSDTDLSISAIAMQCGYESEKYMMKDFKKHTGMTISEYRRMLHE